MTDRSSVHQRLVLSFLPPRHQDVPTRSRYVRLVDNVRDNGGNVRYQNSLSFRPKMFLIEFEG